MQNKLKHVAIIMDGNARWAVENNVTTAQGYKKGVETIKQILPNISVLGISYLSLYAFSSENWQRPVKEISIIMSLLKHYLLQETKVLNKYNIKLKIIGDLSKLSPSMQKIINQAVTATENNSGFTLCIAFSYGGRAEIVRACNKAIDHGIQITEENLKHYLYDPDMPEVDLLIRTGRRHRISNFLLWHSIYAELFFLDKLWPDFTLADMQAVIDDYAKCQRSFGSRTSK